MAAIRFEYYFNKIIKNAQYNVMNREEWNRLVMVGKMSSSAADSGRVQDVLKFIGIWGGNSASAASASADAGAMAFSFN